jgi:tRNA pseudouridine55 synthase
LFIIWNLGFDSMDGILNVNKPQDLTSFDVVARVKQVTRERHVGHAGTLDPVATGVLPICLGQATRVIEFLFNKTKTYRAHVEFGVTTDTYDSTGKILQKSDTSNITRGMIESALVRFRGSILQTPPMYSAIKHEGKPLYKLARSGIEIERKSRPAQISSLEIIEWQPPIVTLDVVCGKGTYIRSLANDLGQALGCGANMKSLIRLRVGPFYVDDALTLFQLEEAFQQRRGENYLYPLDYALLDFNAVVANQEKQHRLIHGAPIILESGPQYNLPPAAWDKRSRVYTVNGHFLGMIKYDPESNLWHPEKIFLKKCCDPK